MSAICVLDIWDWLSRVRACSGYQRIDCVEGGLVEINKAFTSMRIIYDQLLIFDSRYFKVSGAGA